MACFLVPLAEAVVTTTAQIVLEKKGKKSVATENKNGLHTEENKKTTFAKALKPLNVMLWGGSALLAFEHLWHGEITPWFPFLTAAKSSEETAVMLQEMGTIGVTMAVAVTAVWGIALLIKHFIGKRKALKKSSAEELS